MHGSLKSICNHVDEIVVVDTGSTDDTVKIAQTFNCKIVHRGWTGDFSEARNFALDQAAGDWILYIDADERLVVPDELDLHDLISADSCVAHLVEFVPRVGFTPYHEIRLFRRRADIRFKGVIHETVHPDIEKVRKQEDLHVTACRARIVHLGYEGDQDHKHQRNIPLLKEAVRDNPERVFLHTHLGACLLELGKSEQAQAHLKRAVDLSHGNPNGKQHIDGAKARALLISMTMQSSPAKALVLAEEARTEYPQHKALAMAWAKAAFESEQEMEAIPVLEDLLSVDEDSFCDPLAAYDKRLFRDWPADLLGALHARRGNHALAADFYQRAYEFAPEDEAYQRKAELFRALASRPPAKPQ